MATKQNCIEPISKLLRLGAGALLVWAALGPAMAQGIAFRGTASAWTNNTSITISKPTGVVQGDFLMAVIRTRIGAGWNVPSGWTQLMIHTSGGTQVVFYKFAGSSEPTSYTFTATGPHRMAGGIVAYSGVHSATPIDVYNGATGNSTSMAAPSLTTTSANTMLVAFYGINNNVAFTQPASMSLRFSQQTVDSGDFDHQVRVGASDETFGGPGATGTRTATTTSPSGNTWVAQMVALNPGPLTFYSRASGSWTSASTWSTTGHTGSAAPRAPGSVAGDDVIIGNSHTVTLDASQSAVDVTINSTGTLAMGTSVLGGAATFTLNSGGALRIGSAAGITSSGTSGNVQVTGTRTFSTGATYTYNGSAAQATGDGLPTSIAGLTVNNASGVTLSQSTTVTGTLTFTSGTLTTNANTLTIGSAGSVARTSGHVVGNLQKNVAVGATTRTYEIGDASTYRPVTVTFGNVTTAGNLTATVSTSAGDHPNLATSGLDGARSVNRYWTLTNGGVVFDSYSATFTFVAGDVDVGATTSKFLVRRYSSGWSTTTTGTRTATTTQATGITGFGAFAVAEQLLNNFLVEAAGGGNIPTQTAGLPFSIRITARDALNATVTDYTSTVDVTSTGTLSSGGGTTAAFSAGVLSSHSVTITNTGSFTITATRTSGGTQSGTSNSCTVNPGALSTFLVQASGGGNIPTQTAGLPFSIRVTARDAYSNTVTGFTETVNITSTGTLSAGGGTTAAFTAGVLASHSVTISNAGTFTLTATRTSGGTQSGTSNAFVVNAAIYYSRASGNWNVAATWSTTGHTGAAATTTPGSSSADSVVVGSSHTVTLNVNASGVGVRVSSTGQLNLGTFVLSGARTFTLASGGTLGIGSTAGITSSGASGNVQVTGTRSFSTGASYLYNGSAAQATGSGLPATVNNLTVNNGAGVSLTNSVTVSGTLSLTSGALSIGARTLTLNGAITQTSGSLTGGSTSNVTVGGAGASTTLPAVTLNNLTLNRANGLSLGGSVTVGGTLTLTAGALSIGANTLTLNGTVAQASGSLTGGASSNVVVGGTGASTTLPGVTLNTLTLNRANGLSLGGSTTVGGTLTLTSGTLSIGANTLTLNGALAQTGGSLAGGSQSNLVVGGSGVALTLAAIQLGGLTLNRTAGLRMTGDLTVGGTLTLTSGVLTMASGTNLIANTKSVTAGSLRFERELAGQRGWRLLSSPAASTYADLLGGLVTQGFPGSTFPTRSPNVLSYQEDFIGTDNQRWRQPAALTDTLTGGRGWFVYVFGSIPGDPDYNTPLPITIDVGGLEHEGP
ncbi:MAG TPA: hypothetical protein VD962_02535, partial [Rubricoccaceae bacterium]|nr:hypothetical protein [Rubricoccaceae bacterium]